MKNMKKIQTELEGADRFEAGDPLAYHDRDQQFDMGHGCIVIDVIVDVIADAAADAAADAVADSAVDVAGDVVADAAADAAADTLADAVADAAEGGGLSTAAVTQLRTLGMLANGAFLEKAVDAAQNAIRNARGSGSGEPSSPAIYWDALYNEMVNLYPCNAPASQRCPLIMQQVTQREVQEHVLLTFARKLSEKGSNAQDAVTFEKTWPPSNQKQLKDGLTGASTTAGIPSMIKYMSSFQISGNPSAAAAVISEANVFAIVAQFIFTD